MSKKIEISSRIRNLLCRVREWLCPIRQKGTISADEIDLYRIDPVLRFMRNFLRLNWFRAILLYTFLWIFDSLIYSIAFDLFEHQDGIISLWDDLPAQIMVVVISGAILLSYYVWVPNSYVKMIQKLQNQGSLNTINTSRNDQNLFIQIDRLWNCKLFVVFPLVLAIIGFVYLFIPVLYVPWHLQNNWWDIHLFYRLYYFIKTFFFAYVIFRIIFMEGVGVYCLSLFVKTRSLKYKPVDPDRAGGLLPS